MNDSKEDLYPTRPCDDNTILARDILIQYFKKRLEAFMSYESDTFPLCMRRIKDRASKAESEITNYSIYNDTLLLVM